MLDRCALGDRGAFERLYQAASPHLMASVRRMVVQIDISEDVLQEAFVQIWNRAGEYRPDRAKPMTWMTSIARYRALDRLRRQGRDKHNEELEPEIEDETGTGPLRNLAQTQSGHALRECLEVVSLDQRNSITLAYYHGLSHDQISSYLGQPLGTVKSWIKRGLERLKRCLEP
ncbi:MAG: RNA polymerase sigma factor [Gammaproteobacteria bacterium]